IDGCWSGHRSILRSMQRGKRLECGQAMITEVHRSCSKRRWIAPKSQFPRQSVWLGDRLADDVLDLRFALSIAGIDYHGRSAAIPEEARVRIVGIEEDRLALHQRHDNFLSWATVGQNTPRRANIADLKIRGPGLRIDHA